MNIAVLMGGVSPERNVSLAGGKAVVEALRANGHNVFPIDPSLGANGLLKDEDIILKNTNPTDEEMAALDTRKMIECVNSSLFDNIDVAFIVLHGKNGEDGKIQALLELKKIPYTGSDVKASAIGIDKNASKLLFLAAGIPTPPWVVVRKKDYGNYEYYEEVRSELGEQLVVKPNDQGSTIGITIIDTGNLDDIHNAVMEASKYSDIVLIEQFIEGQEITVGIIGDEPLPVIEIIPEGGFYDYEHKYTKGHTEYVCPAEIAEDIAEFSQSLAHSAYLALGCSGFSRADFRLNDDGQPYLMEMNTIPGFTATSLVPMAAKEIGIEFGDICEKIIELALEKFNNKVK